MNKDFEFQEVVVKAGKKGTACLTIQDDDAATVKLLVGILNGVEEGPVVCITGGMYGTQYPGIEACIRLYNEIDPKKLKGTVITVPVVEMTGFQKCMDISPIDGLNPNGYYGRDGLFPGNPNGTISDRIAYTLFNEVVKKAGYCLDLRGGDLWENTMAFWFYFETGNKDFDAKTAALGKILGIKYYLVGSLLGAEFTKGSLISEASKAKINSVVLEASKGLGSCDEEDVQICMKGIHNMLRYLRMMEGSPEISHEPKKLELKGYNLYAERSGLLYLYCQYGEIVSQDKKLGEIRNLKGETLQELFAPIGGIVTYTFPKHIKHAGEKIMAIRRIIE